MSILMSVDIQTIGSLEAGTKYLKRRTREGSGMLLELEFIKTYLVLYLESLLGLHVMIPSEMRTRNRIEKELFLNPQFGGWRDERSCKSIRALRDICNDTNGSIRLRDYAT